MLHSSIDNNDSSFFTPDRTRASSPDPSERIRNIRNVVEWHLLKWPCTNQNSNWFSVHPVPQNLISDFNSCSLVSRGCSVARMMFCFLLPNEVVRGRCAPPNLAGFQICNSRVWLKEKDGSSVLPKEREGVGHTVGPPVWESFFLNRVKI